MLDCLVVYASETGNTRMIAEEIYRALPTNSKKMINIRSWNGSHEAGTYFVGFWTNRGTCSMEIIDLLSSLHGKNVAFFGTCGMGNTPEYYDKIECNASVWLHDDNNFLGSYFCQGKMPMAVRDKYLSLRDRCNPEQISYMIRTFDEALSHPDRQDLLKANIFVDEVYRKLQKINKRQS
ncbi:MAG: flavodoxin family protein [Butyrivibrio sp.]|nr:flavodoxin family protein [Butyrivibrio sp.]